MKLLKILAIVFAVYAVVVVSFESLIGYFQPENTGTLVITTADGAGHSYERVLSRIESEGRLYVAANHWPRGWYRQALQNPHVLVDLEGEKLPYRAVPVNGDEHDRVDAQKPLGFMIRFLTGFPPRNFVRLEPA